MYINNEKRSKTKKIHMKHKAGDEELLLAD